MTISAIPIFTVAPLRIAVASAAVMTSSLANSRRTLTSCVTPTTAFENTTPTNRPSCQCPETSTSTNSTIMMALTGVNTLARTICATVRSVGSVTVFDCPEATRSATSPSDSPRCATVDGASVPGITASCHCGRSGNSITRRSPTPSNGAGLLIGAGCENRTRDHMITSQVLYQLS